MSLSHIKQQISEHPDNQWAHEKGWGPVYTAHKDAVLLIVGHAPGIRAQTSGLSWNDPSGDHLRDWLGISRETFYDEKKVALMAMDFYYPGSAERGDLPPRKGFAERWHPLLRAEMPNIALTLLVGQYAQAYYLGKNRKKNLTETVRSFHEYAPNYFPLVHPSPRNNIWHKKNPWFKEEVVLELRNQVGQLLE